MKQASRIAIIGAGLAGLTCARVLAGQGLAPVIFDKGRGLGGRLSTRRAEGDFQFDHGARYLAARTDGFTAFLDDAEAAGAVARWAIPESTEARVGVPGMTGFAKFMAQELSVRTGTRITRITALDAGWRLDWDGGHDSFDRVIVTAPAPQTAVLLEAEGEVREAMADVRMDPCLTLMIGLADAGDLPRLPMRDPNADLSWIAPETTKPGRPGGASLVAHASPDWSAAHLELEMDEIAARLLPIVARALGRELARDAKYLSAHRWRYALVAKPLGQPFLANRSRTLFAAGDWCLGPTAEDAWASGAAAAHAVIAAL